ncbi:MULTISPECIES: hypothetical protein [Jannaschia]|uniref:hypothetical protein n=1 Tax=Jannaschia TaxID=188905 RepID=UPI001C7CBD18|nr:MULTISPECIES: hypothetical protein [unclassified Jannaschia]
MIRRHGPIRGYDPLSPGPADLLSAAHTDHILRLDLSAHLVPHEFQTARRLLWWRDGGDGIRHLLLLAR